MFVDPSMVALAGAGKAFVSDTTAFDRGGIIAVDLPSGRQAKVVSAAAFVRPFGLICDPGGQLVVTYLGGFTPSGFQSGGTVMRVNPVTGEQSAVAPDFRFSEPAGVALDSARNVIVVDVDEAGSESRILRITPGGSAGILAMNSPPGAIYGSVVIEPSGGILVANLPNHAPQQVLRFDPATGAPTTVSEGQMFAEPLGLALEASGAILVADASSRVIRIDPATGAQTTVSSGGSFSFPSGVAVVS
jgi:DNA-binding beta-propeller fold protein YncE